MCNIVGAIATAYSPIADNEYANLVIATVLVIALIIVPDSNKEDDNDTTRLPK